MILSTQACRTKKKMKMIDNIVKKSLETSTTFIGMVTAIAGCVKDISNLNSTIISLLKTLEAHQKMILMLEEAVGHLAKGQESIYILLSEEQAMEPINVAKKKPTNGDLN